MPDGNEISWKTLAAVTVLGVAVCGAFFFFEINVDKTPEPFRDRQNIMQGGDPVAPLSRDLPVGPIVPASQGS